MAEKEIVVSGFTFVRNATRLYIPVVEAITSVLPLVDEFVVALGDCDADDRSREEIESLGSPKIRFIETTWNYKDYPKNTIYAQQTDIAKEACKGEWLFYIQGDEALHEKYHDVVLDAFIKYQHDPEIEGLLFNYKHFWGDYGHYNHSHVFYPREIRIIRNLPAIHSWKDAQSFRYYDGEFKGRWEDYQRHEGTRKLKVATIPAEIYHYGWVRPPELLGKKRKMSAASYHGRETAEKKALETGEIFDYGPMKRMPVFSDTHPAHMKEWIEKMDWADQLNYSRHQRVQRKPHKHEKPKYRLITWLEQNLLSGRTIGGFRNYVRVRK